MSKIKIASVSYLNSLPFNYGIERSGLISAELSLTQPHECATLLEKGEVDIALIPAALIPQLGDDYQIVSSHCIGASQAVRTVVLVSDEKIEDIENIYLDSDSRTSVKLLAHLAEHHFKIQPKWHILNDLHKVRHANDGDAFLLIGDKAFEHEGEFEYSYDLAQAWLELTSLPFAFAVWCARCDVAEQTLAELEDALTWGVEHTYEAIVDLRPDLEILDAYRYLTENIDTLFDEGKRKSLKEFLSSKSRITLSSTKG